ncbi:hypothetical protein [Streptomyces sp. CO7]
MTRIARPLVGLLAALLLTACGALEDRRPEPPTPMPSNVPTGPQYEKVDGVVSALERAGIDCRVLRRQPGGLHCEARIDGTAVVAEIQAFDLKERTRDQIGDSIAAWRISGTTVVAAGNWFLRVVPNDTPSYSEQIAEALDAVVLPPPYHLPPIPKKPEYANTGALADAVEDSVGCSHREAGPSGLLMCRTRQSKGTSCGGTDRGHDAGIVLHDSRAARNDFIRLLLTEENVTRHFVTAGNWTLMLCDTGDAKEAAEELGGTVIDQYPGDR